MTPINKIIKNKEKELLKIFSDYSYGGLTKDQLERLNNLARYVLALELEARMTERERLIKQISKIRCESSDGYEECYECAGLLADFILADRLRIVDPLMIIKQGTMTNYTKKAIEETLKRAGVEDDKTKD